jgi:tryptophanyl-tRNA synthetase
MRSPSTTRRIRGDRGGGARDRAIVHHRPPKLRKGDPGRPEICPVFALHRKFSPDDVDRIEATCRTGELGCVDCKTILADHLVERFAPFRERRATLEATPGLVREVLAAGADTVRPIARSTLETVRDAMHLR